MVTWDKAKAAYKERQKRSYEQKMYQAESALSRFQKEITRVALLGVAFDHIDRAFMIESDEVAKVQMGGLESYIYSQRSADIESTAAGSGTANPQAAQAFVKSLSARAFMGLPWPKKMAGMVLFIAQSSVVQPIHGFIIGFHKSIVIVGAGFLADDFVVHEWRHEYLSGNTDHIIYPGNIIGVKLPGFLTGHKLEIS